MYITDATKEFGLMDIIRTLARRHKTNLVVDHNKLQTTVGDYRTDQSEHNMGI